MSNISMSNISMSNINHYITAFCNGHLTNVDAYLLLKCSLKYFYETCTKRDFNDLDIQSDEFWEYQLAHLTIQTDPLTRSTLEKHAERYEYLLHVEHEEYNADEEYQYHQYQMSYIYYQS